MIKINYLFLFPDDRCKFCVYDSWVKVAVHECGPFVVFDVAIVLGFWHFNLLAEALLLEIACNKNHFICRKKHYDGNYQ